MNNPSSTRHRTRVTDILITETVRLIEESGPLEDSEAMNQALRQSSEREERLITRARLLAPRLQLNREIERWRDLAFYIWLGLSMVVFFVAYGIAVALIGEKRSINAVLAFFIALGMHALTLLIWFIAILNLAPAGRNVFARLSFGGLFLRLVAWLPLQRGEHSLTMLRAANGLLQRARLLPWAFGFVSHTIWTLTFLLVLTALWFAFSFQAYRLTWETTILSPQFFVNFVQTTGWLPQFIGFSLPDTVTLLDPNVPQSNQRAWAWWLIGCTLVYGLIPRFALAVLSWIVWRRRAQSVTLDTADPYYRKLLSRFDDLEVSTVVDPEQRPEIAVHPTIASPSGHGNGALALIGFELPSEFSWPPGALQGAAQLAEKILGTSQERRAVLNALAEARPYKLLLVCNAASSPDRGIERFLREACGYSQHCALLLAPSQRGHGGNPERWRTWLESIGMDKVPSFTTLDSATEWFKPAHA